MSLRVPHLRAQEMNVGGVWPVLAIGASSMTISRSHLLLPQEQRGEGHLFEMVAGHHARKVWDFPRKLSFPLHASPHQRHTVGEGLGGQGLGEVF